MRYSRLWTIYRANALYHLIAMAILSELVKSLLTSRIGNLVVFRVRRSRGLITRVPYVGIELDFYRKFSQEEWIPLTLSRSSPSIYSISIYNGDVKFCLTAFWRTINESYTVHWNVWDKIKIFFYYEHKFLSNVQNNNVQNNNSVENAWKTRDDSGNTSHISYSNHAKDVL